jgi:hypothetical protein
MRALLLVVAAVLLAGCGGNPTYIPGSAGDYRSPVLSTEKGQLLLGRQVCMTVGDHFNREEAAQSLVTGAGKVERDEATRFVDEALAQCDYLRSAEVKERLVALGEGTWVS